MGFVESTHAKGLRVKPAGPFAILLFAYQSDALARGRVQSQGPPRLRIGLIYPPRTF